MPEYSAEPRQLIQTLLVGFMPAETTAYRYGRCLRRAAGNACCDQAAREWEAATYSYTSAFCYNLCQMEIQQPHRDVVVVQGGEEQRQEPGGARQAGRVLRPQQLEGDVRPVARNRLRARQACARA